MQPCAVFAGHVSDHLAQHTGEPIVNDRCPAVRPQNCFAGAGEVMMNDVVSKEIPVAYGRVEQKIRILGGMQTCELATFVYYHKATTTSSRLCQKKFEDAGWNGFAGAA